ncbi:MAG TPA: SRPBCC family protein [Trebonia sp.]|jgi:carbon monoxide dehydrogenase subunit G
MAIELENTFTVPVAPEQAWDVLLDVERIAPCMPGASVLSVNGDEIEGQVKVKLGPLSLTYKGTAKFTDKDQANRVITIEATGKEARGAGTASATVQADLKPADGDGGTLVSIHTSLNVTGRPAQFGRSLLPEVSGKLIAQFAANLEAMITADNAGAGSAAAAASGAPETPAEAAVAAAAGGEPGKATAVGPVAPVAPVVKQEESLNAFKFVVIPVLKRVLPVAAVGAVVAVIVRRLVGRKSS